MKKNILLVMLFSFVMLFMVACASKKINEESKVEDSDFITNIEDVIWVQCTNGEKTVTVEYTDDAWFLEGNKKEFITQTGVKDMIDAANKLTPIKEVKNPKALLEYGLDKPAYTITMKNKAGDEVTLYIGAVVPVAGAETTEAATDEETAESKEVEAKECYATVGKKDKVYVISKKVMDAMLCDPDEMSIEGVDPKEALNRMEPGQETHVSTDDEKSDVAQEDTKESGTDNSAEETAPESAE